MFAKIALGYCIVAVVTCAIVAAIIPGVATIASFIVAACSLATMLIIMND